MKRFLLNVAAFSALVLPIQFLVVSKVMPQLESKRYVEIVRDAKKSDAVYLSDSVNFWTHASDVDKRRISQFLGDDLPPLKVMAIDGGCFQTEVFASCAELIKSLPTHIKFAVIPINMRSFSPYWVRQPRMQFEELRCCLHWGPTLYQGLMRPLSIFKAVNFSHISYQDYLKTPVFDGDKPLGTVNDFTSLIRGENLTPQQQHDRFAYLYCYHLTPEHRFLVGLRQTVQTFKEAGITPVCFIDALAYEEGTKWYGPEFCDRVKANIAVVQDVLKQDGLQALDLSFFLTDDQFNYRPVITEHLKESGRRRVAARLAEEIRALKLYPLEKNKD